jgi:hypothetical protein
MCDSIATVITLVYHPTSDSFDLWAAEEGCDSTSELLGHAFGASVELVRQFELLRSALVSRGL